MPLDSNRIFDLLGQITCKPGGLKTLLPAKKTFQLDRGGYLISRHPDPAFLANIDGKTSEFGGCEYGAAFDWNSKGSGS